MRDTILIRVKTKLHSYLTKRKKVKRESLNDVIEREIEKKKKWDLKKSKE